MMRDLLKFVKNKKVVCGLSAVAAAVVLVCAVSGVMEGKETSQDKQVLADVKNDDVFEKQSDEESADTKKNQSDMVDQETKETPDSSDTTLTFAESSESKEQALQAQESSTLISQIGVEHTTQTTQTVQQQSQTGPEATTSKKAGQANATSSTQKEASTQAVQQQTQPATQATQPVTQPTQSQTQPATQPATQPVTQPATQPTTACQHTKTTKKVVQAATATSNGSWEMQCANCGVRLDGGSIHAYSAYEVDLGGGKTATVYGYYDEGVASEIFKQLNEYRAENGLVALENRFHAEANIRAMECAYSYGHTRPNGTEHWDMDESLGGENLVNFPPNYKGTDSQKAAGIMEAWKASYGHNLNMLTIDELGGVGVFVAMSMDEYGIADIDAIYAVQLFGTDMLDCIY